MSQVVSRRGILAQAALGAAAVASGTAMLSAAEPNVVAEPAPPSAEKKPILYALNTATIMGQKLPLDEIVEITAKAGYTAIEPWIREIDAYKKSGGSLDDMRKRIADHGLVVVSSIGFANWIVDDPSARASGLEAAKVDMDMVRQIGGLRIAAPAAGATDQSDLDLLAAADRYRALCELGDSMGVTPQVEFWGPIKSLHRMGQALLIASESNHPKACVLPDIYHMYRGGSSFRSLSLLDGKTAIHNFHINDYPGDIPREKLDDSHRVFPGDGAAPLTVIMRDLFASGFDGSLSLELFNRDYWSRDPLEVAKEGLDKMKQMTAKAVA